jgi:hypothetical protein
MQFNNKIHTALTLLETLFCGLQARTHFARPNWKSVFSRLAATHQDARIGMLFMPHQFSHPHNGTSGTSLPFRNSFVQFVMVYDLSLRSPLRARGLCFWFVQEFSTAAQ